MEVQEISSSREEAGSWEGRRRGIEWVRKRVRREEESVPTLIDGDGRYQGRWRTEERERIRRESYR